MTISLMSAPDIRLLSPPGLAEHHDSIHSIAASRQAAASLPSEPAGATSMSANKPRRSPGNAVRAAKAIAWAGLLLVLLELSLQMRSHFRFGQSIFNHATAQSLYTFDKKHQLKLLTPNAEHNGSLALIHSNSLGLRSPEIPLAKPLGELRVAIVGASSVMGAYSKTNEYTMAALLQRQLRQALPGTAVQVINAGIAGAGLSDQRKMLDYIAPLSPDIVVLYPGFNDFADYCRAKTRPASSTHASWHFPSLAMPTFFLTTDLLLKNTVFLRARPDGAAPDVDPRNIDTTAFSDAFKSLLDAAQAHRFQTFVATVARAYRREQPKDEQIRAAQTALYYLPCFTLDALHDVHDRHNEILRDVAASKEIPVVEISSTVPGGMRYFADAGHFNEAGESLAATLIFEKLMSAIGSRKSASQP